MEATSAKPLKLSNAGDRTMRGPAGVNPFKVDNPLLWTTFLQHFFNFFFVGNKLGSILGTMSRYFGHDMGGPELAQYGFPCGGRLRV